MPLALSLATSYLRSRVRQTAISVLGVMMGVGFFIGIAAMMQGFQEFFLQKIVDVAPHITIRDEYRTPPWQPIDIAYPDATVQITGVKPKEERRGIRNARQMITELEKAPGISVAPTLKGQAFITYGGREEAVTIFGIDPVREPKVSNLKHDITIGSLEALKTHANGIILGDGYVRKLGLRLGSKITVTSPTGVIMKMKVVGMFSTGIVSMDDTYGYVRLKKAQVMQDKINVINEIRIRTTTSDKAQEIAADIERRVKYRTESWQESNKNFLDIFIIQNGIMYSTVSAILLVAGFGIFNIISTVINEKQKDIAILKSMGFGEGDLKRIFLLQGFIMGVMGSLLGYLLGYGIVVFLENVDMKMDGMIRSNGFILHKTVWHYIISGTLALISASFAAWLPARKAARMNPVDIIRGAA